MIVGKTRTDVDKLWDAFWTGGITNPVSVIEQITYLLFIRRLDDIESRNERLAARTSKPLVKRIFQENQQHLRWSHFKQLKPAEMLTVVQEEVFPFVKTLSVQSDKKDVSLSTFSKTLSDAVLLIPKPSLLQMAVELISGLDLDNADTSGDLYEYLLSKLSTSGINGQFRTPRHIIRMIVELADPDLDERICDPACGTAGFLFSALNCLLEKYTSPHLIQVDEDGNRYGFVGDQIPKDKRGKFEADTFFGFDFDATMLRVASMNMWLHGIESPKIFYADTLSRVFEEESKYDLILANPPFKGKLDHADCNPTLLSEIKTKKTELLFLVLALRLLDMGGRALIIVPEGVLFGTGSAHVSVRRTLVDDNQLEGVISMPSGIFKPYAGVSTAVLIFTKGGTTDRIWFYDMEHDGFSLDDKRQKIDENDIPDIVQCWKDRHNTATEKSRKQRMKELNTLMGPLKQRRLKDLEVINELQFDSVLRQIPYSPTSELTNRTEQLTALEEEIHTLQREFNQLSRQFWVEKSAVMKLNYDLTASRYRQVERDEEYLAPATVTMERIKLLQTAAAKELQQLEVLVK